MNLNCNQKCPAIFWRSGVMVAYVNKGYPGKDTVSNLQNSIHKDVILVRIQGSPPNIASCQSGLLAHLGKVMVPHGAREFESLTRCQ
jgi:hypothetical protein